MISITRTHWLGASALVLVAAIVLAYWPGLGGGFAFDDTHNILLNPYLSPPQWGWTEWVAAVFSSPSSTLQRPLAMLTFAINARLAGMDPWWMKLTNIGIHAGNAVLVMLACQRLLRAAAPALEPTRRAQVAAGVAALWALAPINLMAVLYVVQRMESLSHTFVFAGLWLYLVGRERLVDGHGGWGAVFAGLFACTAIGVLSKESAALLPLYLLLLELLVLQFRGAPGRVDRRLMWLFGVGIILPTLIALARFLPWALDPSQYGGRSFSLAQRLLTEPWVLLSYLRWTWLPNLSELALFHDDWPVSTSLWSPPATLAGILGVLGLATAAIACRNRRPLTSLGLAWFLSAHLLTATILPLELVFEHRNYFASLGLMLVLADWLWVAPTGRPRARLLGVLGLCLVMGYGVLTHLRAREWSDPLRFAISESVKNPNSPRATFDVARSFINLTGYRPDSPFQAPAWNALEKARLAPHSGILPHQAALILGYRSGLPVPDRWWTDMQNRLRAQPIGPEASTSLIAMTSCAVEGLCAFPRERMLETYGAALSRRDDPGVQSSFGKYAAHVMGDPALALRLWTAARDGDPRNPQFRINLAMLNAQLGLDREAQAEIAALRQLGRFGQYHKAARDLQAYVDSVRREREIRSGTPSP